ncbi:MAG: hypothetical protein HQL51_03550 [Magnetococcales bacterium]|nr:hypothetical protein [Magnetococcales bacterium]
MLPFLALGAAIGSVVGFTAGRKLADWEADGNAGWVGENAMDRQSCRVVQEQVIQEESVILATEDVPLDNRFGNRVLVSEHEFSRTATTTLKMIHTRELDSASEFDVGVLESLVKGRFTQQLGMDMGSQISRRIRLKFEADPGKFVHYRVVWKQESRRGILHIEVKGKSHRLPYLVTYGLFHSVESLPGSE